MTSGVTYRRTNLSAWNEERRGEIELDALARGYLGNAEITDRDRIAFALRELRKRAYDVEASEVDWEKPLMICSLGDAEWESFGTVPSKLYKRLNLIAQTSRLMTELDLDVFLTELYPESDLVDRIDFLRSPYEFDFKGDPELIEAVFQAVGFATRRGLLVPDNGSETHHFLEVAPPTMVGS